MSFLNDRKEELEVYMQRDPAAQGWMEIIFCYPGLHAIWLHRAAHRLWNWNWLWLARFLSHLARLLTGVEIHPGAKLGKRVFIDHGMGIVIGHTSEIGDDCSLYQGVTLGGTTQSYRGKRHPTLERGVIVGAGAKILGPLTISEGAHIGSNAVVLKDIPAGATAVGVPARLLNGTPDTPTAAEPPSASPPPPTPPPPGHQDLPPHHPYAVDDKTFDCLNEYAKLNDRVAQLEAQLAAHTASPSKSPKKSPKSPPENGTP